MNIVIPVKPVPVICTLGLVAAATTCAALVSSRSAGEARAETEAARRETAEVRAASANLLAKADMERRMGIARADEERNTALRRAARAEEAEQEAKLGTKLANEETASLRREFAAARTALEKRVAAANEAASVARVDYESTLAAERYRAGLDINAARTRAESAENKAARAENHAQAQTLAAADARERAAQAERDAANTRAQVIVVQNDTQPQQVPVYIQLVQPAVCPTPRILVNRTYDGGKKFLPGKTIPPPGNRL